MICRSFFVTAMLLGAAGFAHAGSILRTLDPCLSPDGKTIAFSWQGDVWTVATEGGMARRLTVHPAEDTSPKWSPDGSRIFFVSTRAGSLDVYSMSVQGDGLNRVTFESGSEYPTSFSPDGRFLYGYTNNFGRLDVYRVSASGGDIVRLTGNSFEMEYYPMVSPDGTQIAYNSGGAAANWRKPGHAGSNTCRIWMSKPGVPLVESKMVFSGDRNDMFPTFLDNSTLIFVSNRNNGPNIWTGKTTGGGLRQLTQFNEGTIRALSVDKSGSIAAFQKDSRIWILDVKGGSAKPVDIGAPADSPRDPNQEFNLITGASDISVSPNGKRAVIELRGDIFLIPEKGGTTRRLTRSPRRDSQPVWLDDKTILYVAAGDQGLRSFRKVTIDGDESKFLDDAKDLNSPALSPDQKWIAFHRGDREIMVMPATGGPPTKLIEGDFGDGIGGGRSFNWSPDSKWIVYRATRQRGIQIALIRPDGTDKTEVVRIGKSCSTPIFSADGKCLVFGATEGINYSEARDSKNPVYVVDLVPQSVAFSEDDLDKIDAAKEDPTKDVTVKVVARGLANRLRVLNTENVGGIWAGTDPRSVYANIEGQFSTVDLRSGAVKPVATVTGAISGAELSANKQKLYFLQAGKTNAMAIASGAVSPIAFAAQFTVNLVDEEKALFDEIWWAMSRLYYNPAMNNKDWAGIRTKFAQIVPNVQSREDFYVLMGEMLELLDSSHLGANAPAGTRAPGGTQDETAWLGIEWDWQALDGRDAYVVKKVYEGSPASNPDSELMVGDRILTVDGTKPGEANNMATLLNRKGGKKVRLSVMRGDKTVDVLIQPSRPTVKTSAFYDDWVATNRAMVDRLSNGRLGYIHIQGMDVPSLDTFYKEIYTELDGKDGVLLDVRYNGGGFTAHIILNTMLKRPWLIRTNRDDTDHKFSENSYRGNALELPAACLTNQYSFSNAEIFSEGFRYLKLGPVIGEPTAGGVIGTGAYGLWDGGSIRMPGSGAYAINGDNLEQNGRKPDIDVRWSPNDSVAGRDPQLEAAVKELLKKIGR